MSEGGREGEAVPANQRSSWSSFLKSIATVSGDLSSLTAPPFILSPVSLTEFPAYWCEHPAVFAAIADAHTPADRALAVLRWFIATLKGQYTSRNESMGSEKKPLNPVLGELFYGHWPLPAGDTTLLVEQVSHHPPITAYVIENKSKGLRLVGHNAQKTSFASGAIIVKQIGHAILTVTLPSGAKEEYVITLPRLRIDGLWYGSPYIELTETSYIVGAGHVATIEYKGKGYFSGKSHQFKATLVPAPGFGGASPERIIEGTWNINSKFTKGAPNNDEYFHDVSDETGDRKTEVTALGGDGTGGMGEYETRRLWKDVADGIKEGDFEKASREKSRIENEERQKRKDEQANKTTWELKHFRKEESDPIYERLAKLAVLAGASWSKFNQPTEEAYVFLENYPVIPGIWPA